MGSVKKQQQNNIVLKLLLRLNELTDGEMQYLQVL